MSSAVRRPQIARRLACLLLALALAAPMAAGGSAPALAQETDQPRRTFLQRLLFGDGQPEPPRQLKRANPRPKTQKARPKRARAAEPAERSAAPSQRIADAPGAPAAAEKREDARKVLVIGDFLASGLAEGLEQAYAEDPTVLIVDRTNGSSGLVRDDFYNWPEELGTIIEEEKPTAVVAMIGSNDRQQMVAGSVRLDKFSDVWSKEYEKRAIAFAKAARSTGAPLIWVGLPAFKSSSMTSDMLTLNDVYARVATNAKGEFVDIWDGFVDENGVFVFSGPDINGQPVRLRGSDGINLTRAARRKVAFYVEKPLNKVLDDTAVSPEAPSVPALPGIAGVPNFGEPAAVPRKIDRTPPMGLNDPELDGATVLLGERVEPAAANGIQRPGLDSVGSTPPPGRADDFSAAALPETPRPVLGLRK